MQYRYYYRRNSLHKVQFWVLGAFSLVLLVFAALAFNRLTDASGADANIFLFMGIGFVIPGLALLWYAYYYYSKLKEFFERDDWYGVTIGAHKVHCVYFDMLRKREWEVELHDIREILAGSTRQRKWIAVKNSGPTRFISVNLLREADYIDLYQQLKKYEKPT